MKPGDLSLHLEAYLALKKALGFPLGARESLLRDFVVFAESNGVGVGDKPSAQSRTVIETARIAAAAHAFNVVGVTG